MSESTCTVCDRHIETVWSDDDGPYCPRGQGSPAECFRLGYERNVARADAAEAEVARLRSERDAHRDAWWACRVALERLRAKALGVYVSEAGEEELRAAEQMDVACDLAEDALALDPSEAAAGGEEAT